MTRRQNQKTEEKSLKDQNGPALFWFLALNFVVLAVTVSTGVFTLNVGDSVADLEKLLPAAVGVPMAGILNQVISSRMKAVLIFWRWRHPLPASRAFSHYAYADPRINVKALKKRVGRFPSTPARQNALWYKLYRQVAHEPAVKDAHRRFLLSRDCAVIAFLMLGVGGFTAAEMITSTTPIVCVLLFIFAQLVVTRQAAYNSGCGMVTTVLAIQASN